MHLLPVKGMCDIKVIPSRLKIIPRGYKRWIKGRISKAGMPARFSLIGI
jgi:hypothetical protein